MKTYSIQSQLPWRTCMQHSDWTQSSVLGTNIQ